MRMDSPASAEPFAEESLLTVNAVLAEVTCNWDEAEGQTAGRTTAVVVHNAHGVLVLEASDPKLPLPPVGAPVAITGMHDEPLFGRLAEQGRGGRFLVSVGDRPVRRSPRLRVALPGALRAATVPTPMPVEIVDLTTGGARVRGVELPVGSEATLEFTPPGREEAVSVRAVVVHGTHLADKPWVGVRFRLVAMRGGR